MRPEVSIIIVNYNSEKTIGRCLESIKTHVTGISYEVIVVDNASKEISVQIIQKSYPDVIVLRNEINVGFGAANNRGAQYAKGNYLFFLNPDTILQNDAVLHFYRFMENIKPEAAAVGGNLRKENGEATTSYGNFPTIFQEWSAMGFYRFYPTYYKNFLQLGKNCTEDMEVKAVPYIVGADIFMKKKLFFEIGGFDPHFFLYYEETDLFYRLFKKGYQAYILPQVSIIHLEGAAMLKNGKLNMEKWRHWEKSKYYFFNKNHGLLAAITVKGMQILSLTVHWLFGERVYPLLPTIKITWQS